jgi:glutathione synthase/RimK-type ligase-like ATP-grasp enzyme
MTKLVSFDVLIVYNGRLAVSASDKSTDINTPFPSNSSKKEYNDVYAYFLKKCQQSGLTVGFSTSSDIIGPGFCRSSWQLKDAKWVKSSLPCYSSLIFDKFSPIKGKGKILRQLLFSSKRIKPFNNPSLFDLFFDKQKTYEKLSQYAIPTVPLKNNDIKSLKRSCLSLSKLTQAHPFSADFSSDIIIKDRFGAGGHRIHKFDIKQPQQMLPFFSKKAKTSYIIQPFIKFGQGFTYNNCSASTDIRLIYFNDKIVQSYIRTAKAGEFRCNEHRGGRLTYLSLNKLPSTLIAKSNQIAKILNKKLSLFTLDFIISDAGHPYLLEGNTGPGLDWDVSRQKNEIEAKKLINLIVQNLTARARNGLVN